jgi:hypothetical protein
VELCSFFFELPASSRTHDVHVMCWGMGREFHVRSELAPLAATYEVYTAVRMRVDYKGKVAEVLRLIV